MFNLRFVWQSAIYTNSKLNIYNAALYRFVRLWNAYILSFWSLEQALHEQKRSLEKAWFGVNLSLPVQVWSHIILPPDFHGWLTCYKGSTTGRTYWNNRKSEDNNVQELTEETVETSWKIAPPLMTCPHVTCWCLVLKKICYCMYSTLTAQSLERLKH